MFDNQPYKSLKIRHPIFSLSLAGLSQLEGVAVREAALDGHRDQKVCTTKAIFSSWSGSFPQQVMHAVARQYITTQAWEDCQRAASCLPLAPLMKDLSGFGP
jgi:hypothetical protein